jgi:phage repressor protein C with HTH and peptisase S24 domain
MLSDPRLVLERLCAERGEDFAGLSRMLGRNPAYIQQFVRRGVPRRLGEEERRKLARYFAIPEAMLGGPPDEREAAVNGLLSVKRHPIAVSAGPGAIPGQELGKPCFAFDERWLKGLTPSSPANLSIVRVEGDSMAPTLNAGDDILVDLGDAAERLRDGIYVLRIDEALVVKRLALNPLGGRFTVQSDNPAYSDWPDCRLDEINCIGRVIWSGRRIV